MSSIAPTQITRRVKFKTSVDFSRSIPLMPINLVQYDKNAPVIEISLLNNNKIFKIPQQISEYSFNIRLKKADGTFVYNPCLGEDFDNYQENFVYFEITEEMTECYGDIYPVIEFKYKTTTDGDKEFVIQSSPIHLQISKNPIQNGDIKSQSESFIIKDYVNEYLDNHVELYDKLDKVNPTGSGSLSIGRKSGTDTGTQSMAVGYNVTASGEYSNATGYLSQATGVTSHAEGNSTEASGVMSHSEGYNSKAIGDISHAEGYNTRANGEKSHAEGDETQASGYGSHSEGIETVASGYASHAEGDSTQASGFVSHAEGADTVASSNESHAEGLSTVASGSYSHSEGRGTVASGNSSHASGKYNVDDSSKIFQVGIGTNNTHRKDGMSLDYYGNLEVAGDIQNGDGYSLSETRRRADYSIALQKGITYTEESDSTTAYTKSIPVGAKQYSAIDIIGGKSIVWSQLIQPVISTPQYSRKNFSLISEGVVHYDGTDSDSFCAISNNNIDYKANHKYVFKFNIKLDDGYSQINMTNWHFPQWTHYAGVASFDINREGDYYVEYTPLVDFSTLLSYIDDGFRPTIAPFTMSNIQLLDLTAMFGSGNEPTIEQFKKMFPAEYYPYTEPTVMNMGVDELFVKGRNIWDEVWENGYINTSTGVDGSAPSEIRTKNYIPCDSSATYCLIAPLNMKLVFYNDSKTFIRTAPVVKNSTFTTPSDAKYIRITMGSSYGSSYKNDIAIIKGNTVLPYTPYLEKTTTIPQSIIDKCPLYGVGINDSAKNYIDFENKKYVQMCEVVDLGESDCRYKSVNLFKITVPVKLRGASFSGDYISTNKAYNLLEDSEMTTFYYSLTADVCILIKDSRYTDAATFKTAMAGVKLIYELAEPVEVDLSNDIPDSFEFLEVEGGGSITFKNQNSDDYKVGVPSKMTYQVDIGGAL